MKKILYIFVIAAVALSSCSKYPEFSASNGDDNPNTDDPIVDDGGTNNNDNNNNTDTTNPNNTGTPVEDLVVIDATALASCTSLEEGKIVFSTLGNVPEIGNIINGGISEKTPNGFLGKVTSVSDGSEEDARADETAASVVTISFDPISLNNVFSEFKFDETFYLVIDNVKYIDSVEKGDNKEYQYSITYKSDDKTDVELDFTPDVSAELKYTIKDGKTTAFEFKVGSSIDLLADLNICAKDDSEFEIMTISYKAIEKTVGGVTIVLRPETVISLSLDVLAESNFKILMSSKVSSSISFDCMNQTSSISIQSPSGSIDNFDDYENGGITDVVKMSIDFSTSLYPYSYEDACVTADVTVAELILSAGEDEDEGTST
ncbi:MAG: hypothetical protein SNI46_02780 [Rikenellaceae bacterium]